MRRPTIAFLKDGLGCMIVQHRKLRSYLVWGFAWDGSVFGFSGGKSPLTAIKQATQIAGQPLTWRPVPMYAVDLVAFGRAKALRRLLSCSAASNCRCQSLEID